MIRNLFPAILIRFVKYLHMICGIVYRDVCCLLPLEASDNKLIKHFSHLSLVKQTDLSPNSHQNKFEEKNYKKLYTYTYLYQEIQAINTF